MVVPVALPPSSPLLAATCAPLRGRFARSPGARERARRARANTTVRVREGTAVDIALYGDGRRPGVAAVADLRAAETSFRVLAKAENKRRGGRAARKSETPPAPENVTSTSSTSSFADELVTCAEPIIRLGRRRRTRDADNGR